MAKLEDKIKNKMKDNPRLLQRTLKDGRIGLYLEYYMGRSSEPVLDECGEPVLYKPKYNADGELLNPSTAGKPKYEVKHIRKQETLPYHLIAKPRTRIERQQNDKALALAKEIRNNREQEFKENKDGFRLWRDKNINFLDYFDGYLARYTKRDKGMIKIAYNRFKDFLRDTPEYNNYGKRITPMQIDIEMMEAFTEYLQSRSIGEGAASIWQRFKKVYKSCGQKYKFDWKRPFTKEDGNMLTITVDKTVLRKQILSVEEMEQLIAAYREDVYTDVRKAFIFCLYTGVRFCDVKELTYNNIDDGNHILTFSQSKTKKKSKNSGVIIPLNDDLLGLIGKPTQADNRDELIFTLPVYKTCLNVLKRWVKDAGINKHISWHCARHTFAVNILNNGANIKTLASLLGHSDLKHTETYTRVVDSLKKQAIDSLPPFKID